MEKFGIEIKWAAIFTLFSCVWAFGEKQLGIHQDFSNIVFSTLALFLAQIILILIFFIDKKKNFFGNEATFSQLFKSGLFYTGIITLLSPLAIYIIYQSISPEYFDNLINYQLAKGRFTKESLLETHNIDVKIREGVTYTLSMGVIFSALFATVFKKK